MPKYIISLQDFIDLSDAQLTKEEILKIIIKVLKAVKHLHSIGYIHNDIKPSNIMLGDSLSVTLIDFGFCK